MTDYTVDIITEPVQLQPLEDRWRELAVAVGAFPCSTPEWIMAWVRHYLDGRPLKIMIVRDGHELVAVAPLMLTRLPWTGGYRLLRSCGSDSTISHAEILVRPGHEQSALDAIVNAAMDVPGVDTVALGPMRGRLNQEDVGVLMESVSAATGTTARSVRFGNSMVTSLPGSFDDFLGLLGRSGRKAYRRRLKRFMEHEGARISHISAPDEIASELDQFIDMHTRQWNAEGRLGHFGDWSGAVEFHRDLAVSMAAKGQCCLLRLDCGGAPVAYQYAFISGTTASTVLIAREDEPALRNLSLGTIAYFEFIRYAIEHGVRTLDDGIGSYDYKTELGGTREILQHAVFTRRPGLRLSIALGMCRLVNKIYYAAWYKRIRPMLRLSPRPLRKTWMRMRI